MKVIGYLLGLWFMHVINQLTVVFTRKRPPIFYPVMFLKQNHTSITRRPITKGRKYSHHAHSVVYYVNSGVAAIVVGRPQIDGFYTIKEVWLLLQGNNKILTLTP